MSKHTTIEVDAKRYADHDDCLTAAAEDYCVNNPEAADYDFNPRWKDDQRDSILLDVPVC